MLQMKLVLQGKVQKVGFRWGVLQHVQEAGLDVKGHVVNLPDGRVEIVAQGPIEALKALHRYATKGPPCSEVREFEEEITEIKSVTFDKFTMG